MSETTAIQILSEQEQSRRIAKAIGALCPGALFCIFSATSDGRKLPHSKTGVGVSDQTPKTDLYKLDEVLMHELAPNQFWGLYMHEPVFDCFNEFVLTLLDVDMKRSMSPSDIRIKQLGSWAKTNNHLTELSHSKKGRHVIFLAKPDQYILPKYKLIDRQEIEVFGQPNSPKKSVMLTGFDMTTDALNTQPVDLSALIKQLNLEPDEPPIKTAPAAPATHSQSTSDIDKAAYALSHISPDLDYSEWIMLGQALHDEFGDMGRSLWQSWSANGQKYQGDKDIESHWKSFHQGSGVSIGTLFHMAKQHGYTPATPKTERKTAVDDFIQSIKTHQTNSSDGDSQIEFTSPKAPDYQPIPTKNTGWEELPYSLNHLPAVRYLIPKFLAHGFWILAGQPGVGKTSVLCSLMMLMSNQPMDGCTIEHGEKRKTIIVTEDAEQVQRTLFGYVRQFQLDPTQITSNVVIIRAKRSSLPDLLTLKDNIERHTITTQDKLIRPLLILDTANATLDLENENDNSEVGAYISGLKSTIYTLLNTSIVLVTHLNKQISRNDSDAMARGASAFTGDATGTMVVFMDEDGTRYLRLIKRRYEPEIDELRFTTTTFTAPAVTDDGEFIEQVCRVMVPEPSSELERRQQAAEQADEIQAQRIRKKVDEAITFVLNVINQHPEGVVMRKGSNASRTPPADMASMFALNWDDIYQAIPGSARSDVKRMIGDSVMAKFCSDPKNNAWNRLEA